MKNHLQVLSLTGLADWVALPALAHPANDNFANALASATAQEPQNTGAAPTNTWHLRDAVDFDFPTGVTIAPGDSILVVSFDPVNNPSMLAAFRARYNVVAGVTVVGPYTGKLVNDTDDLELRRPDPPDLDDTPYFPVERVEYSDTAPWPALADGTGFSLQRVSSSGFGNDPTNWFGATPTPGPQAASGDSDGDGATNVHEYGAAALTYRWLRDGRPLAGQTGATLMLNNVQPADAGKYSVSVTHQLPSGAFSARSSNAVPTIIAPAQSGFYRLRLP